MLKQLLFLFSVFCFMNIKAQVANQPTPLEICDDDVDELAIFDLTEKNDEITVGNPNLSVAFYETNADAQSQANVIINPTNYENRSVNGNPANPQTLFVVVTDTATSNVAYTTLTLRVNPTPTPTTVPDLQLCDDIINDGLAVFDLTINELYIINGEAGVNVSFYTSQSDAEFGSNVIIDPTTYVNTSSPQTIYARAEIVTTGCFTVVDFDILVNPNPVAPNLEENYQFCQGESLVIDSGVDANNFSISWFYQGVLIAGEINPDLIVNQAGTYSLELFDVVTSCNSLTATTVTEVSCIDTDSDGVIDVDEDLNSNGDLTDDDTDMDGIPNYLDDDDDGDTVDTIDEVTIPNGRMAQHSFIDTDMDAIENYLDDDDDGDLVLTINEDYNNNGDPTDDDTNMNSVPDYLDADVALSVTDYILTNFSLFPNPANNVLNIKLKHNLDANLGIYDIQGKLILERSISEEEHIKLNISDLQSGLYFVKLNTANQGLVKKLIIE